MERLSRSVLPPAVHRFLFSQSEEFQVTRLVLRALFGAASGTILFLGVCHSLPLTFDLKLVTGGVFVAVCAVGGALSSCCRCSVLLMIPSMLGSRGQTYLLLLVLSELYRGPVSNIQSNVETAALTLSCNLDLQLHHSKLLWRDAIRPFVVISQELLDDDTEFQSEARSVGRKFRDITDEVVHQYGFDSFRPPHAVAAGNSTQEQFAAKTKLQCDSVVELGVQQCADWFRSRWAECMEAVHVPVINHVLCVSMKFSFLCDVMRVMTPWCRDQIPVEGNFGQLFDQLNRSVDLLSREFSAELVLKEQQQQDVVGGAVPELDFSEAVRGSLESLRISMETTVKVLQLLLSFSFISIFTQAFGYLRQYRRDIRFDNIYITSYFRKIDAHRKRAGLRCLLPLTAAEREELIEPCRPRLHPEELHLLSSGVCQLLSVSLLVVVLLTVDVSVFHVMDIISRHTHTQFNLTGRHQVDIAVGGDSMMARLLRKTVSAFNSSSSADIHIDTRGVYVSSVFLVLVMALCCLLQVYTQRLRRVISAYYNPQVERRRVLFLYHLHLYKRRSSSDRKRIIERRQSGSTLPCLTCCHVTRK